MRMGSLEISFYGPFVAILDHNPIEIYAPRCAGHYGSIFTPEKEAPLNHDFSQGMNNIYEFTQHGIQANTGPICRTGPAPLLSPPKGFGRCGDLSRAWFRVQLLKPRSVVGIKPESVKITGTNAPAGTSYATALRLIYDYDMDAPFVEFGLIGGKPILRATLQDYSAASQSLSSKFDITIRVAGPFLFDSEHDDARECFKATARMFQSGSTYLDWEADYEAVMHIYGRPGSDCGAPGLVSP
jgi:hypothetical protein